MLLENLPHRRAHRKFPEPWPLNFAADAEQLRASVFGPAQSAKPIGSVIHDVMNIAKRLHVLHNRRFSPEPGNLREWRLRSRMRALSLEPIEHSGFFPAHVAASADVKMNFKPEAGPY